MLGMNMIENIISKEKKLLENKIEKHKAHIKKLEQEIVKLDSTYSHYNACLDYMAKYPSDVFIKAKRIIEENESVENKTPEKEKVKQKVIISLFEKTKVLFDTNDTIGYYLNNNPNVSKDLEFILKNSEVYVFDDAQNDAQRELLINFAKSNNIKFYGEE